jgi:hypothetical protein
MSELVFFLFEQATLDSGGSDSPHTLSVEVLYFACKEGGLSEDGNVQPSIQRRSECSLQREAASKKIETGDMQTPPRNKNKRNLGKRRFGTGST